MVEVVTSLEVSLTRKDQAFEQVSNKLLETEGTLGKYTNSYVLLQQCLSKGQTNTSGLGYEQFTK